MAMFDSSLPLLFVGGRMTYLRYLCLLAHSDVQHILCSVFFSSSCVPYVASFSRLSFLIARSVFCNVYYWQKCCLRISKEILFTCIYNNRGVVYISTKWLCLLQTDDKPPTPPAFNKWLIKCIPLTLDSQRSR